MSDWCLFRPWRVLLFLYRAKLITVEPAAFLFVIGLLMYIPLYEQYIYQDYGSHLLKKNDSFSYPNGSFCITNDLLKNYTGDDTYKKDNAFSNHLVVYCQLANKIPEMIVTIILGPLTDHYGRKVGLILPAIGGVLQGVLSVLIIQYNLNLYYFILANFLAGLFVDATSLVAASFAYIADVGSVRWRSLRIGIIEFIFAFGGGIGQFLGGFWLHRINCNFVPPMCFIIALNLFIAAYAFVLVPESLTHSERKTLQSKNPKGIRAYIEGFRIFCGRLPPILTWKLWVALIALIVIFFNVTGSMLISVYFLKSPPFNFNPLQIEIYQSVKSASGGLSNLFITGALVVFGVTDVWIMLLSYVFHSVCCLLLGFSVKAWQVYTIAVFKGVEYITYSGGRGLMSKLVKPEQQGAMFSIVASAEALSLLLSSVIWPDIYPLTLLHNMKSGITYIFMGVLGFMVIPLILSLLLFGKEPAVSLMQTDLDSIYTSTSSSESSHCGEVDYRKPLLTGSEDDYLESSINT